jgi:hypothetical protein
MAMLIRNPYRITRMLELNETVPVIRRTASGLAYKSVVRAMEWCEYEAARFRASGTPAKAVKRDGKCYVVRSSNGVKIDPKDKDLEGVDSEE